MDPSEFLRESGTLEERLSSALGKLALVGRSSLGHTAQAGGLSPLQALVLERLARFGPTSMGDLARLLGVTLPTMSDSVAALERKGLVVRHPEEGSRRVQVSLTAQGKRLVHQQSRWVQVFAEALAVCSEAEKVLLLHLLLRLIAHLIAQGVIAEARLCLTCRYFRPYVHEDRRHPHHCALVDVPLSDAHLRVDCPDQQPVPGQEVRHRLELLRQGA